MKTKINNNNSNNSRTGNNIKISHNKLTSKSILSSNNLQQITWVLALRWIHLTNKIKDNVINFSLIVEWYNKQLHQLLLLQHLIYNQ